MNITESIAWQGIAAFLRGEVDHCDALTRQKIAHDLEVLDDRAHKAIHAGTVTTMETWDELLCDVTFDGGAR